MMSAAEKIWMLAFCEVRLLLRSRTGLAVMIALPLIGGLCMGFAARGSYESPAGWGLFAILPICGLILFRRLGRSRLLPPGTIWPAPGVRYGSQALAGLPILAVQGAVYVGLAGLLGGGSASGAGMLVGALVASLALGLAVSVLLNQQAR